MGEPISRSYFTEYNAPSALNKVLQTRFSSRNLRCSWHRLLLSLQNISWRSCSLSHRKCTVFRSGESRVWKKKTPPGVLFRLSYRSSLCWVWCLLRMSSDLFRPTPFPTAGRHVIGTTCHTPSLFFAFTPVWPGSLCACARDDKTQWSPSALSAVFTLVYWVFFYVYRAKISQKYHTSYSKARIPSSASNKKIDLQFSHTLCLYCLLVCLISLELGRVVSSDRKKRNGRSWIKTKMKECLNHFVFLSFFESRSILVHSGLHLSSCVCPVVQVVAYSHVAKHTLTEKHQHLQRERNTNAYREHQYTHISPEDSPCSAAH